MFALILTKALFKTVFSLFFALILTKDLPKRMFSSIFDLILIKALPKWVCFFFLLCLYSNQNPTRKGVLLFFFNLF